MKIAAASAVGCSTRLDQHAGCACVRHPIAVRCSAAMAHCDSGLATGQIPLALRGRLRRRPKVVHPPAVERACILRVLVGAQAAPVLACTLARRALSSIIVRCSKSVPLPRHVAAPAAGVSRCANLGDSTSAPDSVASNTSRGNETLCSNLMPVIPSRRSVISAGCALDWRPRRCDAGRLLHAPSRLAPAVVHEHVEGV
jgi:hypothetical protein